MISRRHLRILIVEDNPAFAHLLELILNQIGVEKFWVANNFDTGFRLFQAEDPDLCILDIELEAGENTGIKLAERIREKKASVPIIYMTSHYNEDYYQKTQHTRPSGFMSKEVSQFKLEVAIDSAMLIYDTPQEEAGQLSSETRTNKPLVIASNQFFFKVGDLYKSIPIKDIKYFYADQKLTYARVGNRNFPTNVQLKVLEDEFRNTFARIHKSYLINIEFAESINPRESTITLGGESLPIGYAFRKLFFDRLKLLK